MNSIVCLVAYSKDPFDVTNLGNHQAAIEYYGDPPEELLKSLWAEKKKSYEDFLNSGNIYGVSLSYTKFNPDTGIIENIPGYIYTKFGKIKKKTTLNPTVQKETPKAFIKPSWCNQEVWDQTLKSLEIKQNVDNSPQF